LDAQSLGGESEPSGDVDFLSNTLKQLQTKAEATK